MPKAWQRTGSVWGEEQAARARQALALGIFELATDAITRWQTNDACRRYADDEINITSRVISWMRKLAAQRGMRLVIVEERTQFTAEMLDGEADARGAPRMDISITDNGNPDDWHLVLECKRLGRGAGAREYVAGGLMDFVSGRYCPESDWSGMLGYIVSSDADLWLEHLNTEIVKHEELGSEHVLTEADWDGCRSHCFASSHVRSCLVPIQLRHLWFDLEADFARHPSKVAIESDIAGGTIVSRHQS